MVQPQIVYHAYMNQPIGRLQISAFREPASFDFVSFFMRVKHEGTGIISLPHSIVYEEQDYADAAVYTPPAFVMSASDAQTLMEDLWNMGIRPSQLEDPTGELVATKRHLQDYRNLVAKLLAKAGVPVDEA